MVLPVQFKTDWEVMRMNRQKEINRNNQHKNRNRINHTYKPDDMVMLTVPGIKRKLSSPRTGPYKVIQVYDNGTIHIQKGAVAQRVNIRRVTPYYK